MGDIIDWLTNNIGKALPILLLVLWAVARGKSEQSEESSPERPTRMPTAEELAEAERTRRIQEEIRRRIAERQRQEQERQQEEEEESDAPFPRPPATAIERPIAPPAPELEPEEEAPRPPPPVPVVTAVPERSVNIFESQLRELNSTLATTTASARTSTETSIADSADAVFAVGDAKAAPAARGRELSAALRDRAQARRALLLREVLGPPVGLRG